VDTAQLQPEQFVTERLQISQSAIADFCQRWKIAELALFGSVLRDDFRDDSDVDVLVTFASEQGWNFFDIMRLQTELEGMFGRLVDVTQKQGLQNPFSRVEILRTHRVIYPPEKADQIVIQLANKSMQDHVRNGAALLDMVEAMHEIQTFIRETTYEQYLANLLLKRALERDLEILGEAANRLTAGFQAEYPEVDWRNVVGLRNVIIHQYDRVDDAEVWRIATEVLPELLTQIEELLPPLPNES
jgi:uncharacterized protein with HEPN domain/predicted nucleotidyltransferase